MQKKIKHEIYIQAFEQLVPKRQNLNIQSNKITFKNDF